MKTGSLGVSFRHCIFESSPGDSSVQPKLRTIHLHPCDPDKVFASEGINPLPGSGRTPWANARSILSTVRHCQSILEQGINSLSDCIMIMGSSLSLLHSRSCFGRRHGGEIKAKKAAGATATSGSSYSRPASITLF